MALLHKRSPVELVLIAVVVVLTVLLSIGLFRGEQQGRSRTLLVHELTMMREAITTYKMVNRANPSGLSVLVSEQVDFGDGVKRSYLEDLPGADPQSIVDPFGNPYAYDAAKGWVSSTTSGFESW